MALAAIKHFFITNTGWGIGGPFTTLAAQIFVAGIIVGQVPNYAVVGQVHIAGAIVGQVSVERFAISPGAIAGEVFTTGAVVGQIK